MKKIALLFLFTIITLTAVNAQHYKWWAGGKTTLWLESERATAIIAPEIGYHLTNKLTLAASAGIYSYVYDNIDNRHGLVLNPYVRYNALKKDNLVFCIDGGMEIGLGDMEGFQLGFKPGMAILLSDRVTIALHLGFIGYNDGKGIGNRREGIGFDLSGYQSGFAICYSF